MCTHQNGQIRTSLVDRNRSEYALAKRCVAVVDLDDFFYVLLLVGGRLSTFFFLLRRAAMSGGSGGGMRKLNSVDTAVAR